MRYPAEETAEKNRRLRSVAARMIRERGIDAVSVSEVMKASGMTHGAFYSHFDSKDDLASAAILEAMAQANATLAGALAEAPDPKDVFLHEYLGIAHRDHAGVGCPMPALAVDIGRRGRDRAALSGHIRGLIDRVVAGFSWSRRGAKRDQAILMTAAMVGAMVLARGVDDPDLSEEILAATRRQLLA